MYFLSLIRLVILFLAAVGFFAVIQTHLRRHALKGYRLIATGFALVYVNIVIGPLFHSGILPANWNDKILPAVGFITGYFGETIGLLLLLFGNYRLVRSLIPQLSEHYSSLVERSLVGVYLIQDGSFQFVNAKLAEIFGYTREELHGRSIDDLTSEESRPIVDQNIRKRMGGKEDSVHYSFIGLRKNGTRIRVEVYGSRTMHNGRPAVHGTLLDITQRKQAEETLRESEARFRSVVQSLGEGLVITDIDDTVRYINSRMSDLCGYTAEEIGKPAYTLLIPEDE